LKGGNKRLSATKHNKKQNVDAGGITTARLAVFERRAKQRRTDRQVQRKSRVSEGGETPKEREDEDTSCFGAESDQKKMTVGKESKLSEGRAHPKKDVPIPGKLICSVKKLTGRGRKGQNKEVKLRR